jgi:hypothetical protein
MQCNRQSASRCSRFMLDRAEGLTRGALEAFLGAERAEMLTGQGILHGGKRINLSLKREVTFILREALM